MKCGNSSDLVYKDVVVIGNGPSGIALSYMLSGNIPYVVSDSHPDEFLSARLAGVVNKSLVTEDLEYLSQGLEGRTTNPVSLLLDSLIHPYADIGLDLDSLVEWRNDGHQIDHIVLGKGPPGGSWHSMDPEILTLSLGTWMALPGVKYEARDRSEKRASAKNVAKYYESYVEKMKLTKNFNNNVLVTNIRPYCDLKSKWVEKVNNDISKKMKLCARLEAKEKEKRKCTLSNALNYIISNSSGRLQRYYKRSRMSTSEDFGISANECRFRSLLHKHSDSDKPVSSCDFDYNCDKFFCIKDEQNKPIVPNNFNVCDPIKHTKWIVEAYDLKTKKSITYTCNHLVLANGSSDLPNKLSISNYKTDPFWLLHDLRSLEIELDLHTQESENPDPVLIVGAGLSAADAIIAIRARNIPVLHVFRNKGSNLSKQLPENMYPEYHKVHEMMKGDCSYPLYTPLPECSLTNLDEDTRTAHLTSNEGKEFSCRVSFAAVLIGSRPDMSFLPSTYNIAVKKNQPIDCKKNAVHINKLNHGVTGVQNLYAIGPLAGDNFVRFLPGGALAVLSDLYTKYF